MYGAPDRGYLFRVMAGSAYRAGEHVTCRRRLYVVKCITASSNEDVQHDAARPEIQCAGTVLPDRIGTVGDNCVLENDSSIHYIPRGTSIQ